MNKTMLKPQTVKLQYTLAPPRLEEKAGGSLDFAWSLRMLSLWTAQYKKEEMTIQFKTRYTFLSLCIFHYFKLTYPLLPSLLLYAPIKLSKRQKLFNLPLSLDGKKEGNWTPYRCLPLDPGHTWLGIGNNSFYTLHLPSNLHIAIHLIRTGRNPDYLYITTISREYYSTTLHLWWLVDIGVSSSSFPDIAFDYLEQIQREIHYYQAYHPLLLYTAALLP